MSPDDPRHGSTRGYRAGCKCADCLKAVARDEKARRLDKLRGGRAVPAYRAQRRIQALMRLGWSATNIADAAGWADRNHVHRILRGQKGKPTTWLERKTHATICDVYERLSMQLPPDTPQRTRTVLHAERQGYAPPLAWDDIDDPNEKPYRALYEHDHKRTNEVDEAVVWRVLSGERLTCTKAEKDEIMRRWLASGKPAKQLADRMGWKDDRYGKGAA